MSNQADPNFGFVGGANGVNGFEVNFFFQNFVVLLIPFYSLDLYKSFW